MLTQHEVARLNGAIDYLEKNGFYEPAKSIRVLLGRAPSEREKAPDIVVRALKAMAEEKMAVGFDETNVRKCCETKPEEAHDPECLVFHALAALGDA